MVNEVETILAVDALRAWRSKPEIRARFGGQFIDFYEFIEAGICGQVPWEPDLLNENLHNGENHDA